MRRIRWTKREQLLTLGIIAAALFALPWVAISIVVALGCFAIICVIGGAYAFACWLLACDDALPKPQHNGDNGFGESLSIMAFILTQLIALTASQIGRRALRDEPLSFQIATLLTYGPIAIATFVILAVRLRLLTDDENGNAKRVFSPAGVTFMRWILVLGLLLPILFICFAWAGELPTQTKIQSVPIKVIHAEPWKMTRPEAVKDTNGVRVIIPISRMDFPEGNPKKLLLNISVGPRLYNNSWRIAGVTHYDGEPEVGKLHEEKKEHNPPASVSYNVGQVSKPPRRTIEVVLQELQPQDHYTAILFLFKSVDTSAMEAADLADKLNDPEQKDLLVVAQMKSD